MKRNRSKLTCLGLGDYTTRYYIPLSLEYISINQPVEWHGIVGLQICSHVSQLHSVPGVAGANRFALAHGGRWSAWALQVEASLQNTSWRNHARNLGIIRKEDGPSCFFFSAAQPVLAWKRQINPYILPGDVDYVDEATLPPPRVQVACFLGWRVPNQRFHFSINFKTAEISINTDDEEIRLTTRDV